MPSDIRDTDSDSNTHDARDTDRTGDTAPADESTTLSRRRLLGTAAATGTAGLAGCSAPLVQVRTTTDTVEREFDTADVSRIRVGDADAAVAFERTDGDTVRVRAHKRARGSTEVDELELRSRVEGGALYLGTHEPPIVGIGGGSVDLAVFVPGEVAVDRVRTDDGSVTLRGVSGDPTVQTGDGDVVASDVRGDLDAATEDGDVTVERTTGVVAARSDDGDVLVRAPGSIGDLRTGDGDVTAEIGEALDATIDATTGDGNVTATGIGTVETVTDTHVAGTLGEGTDELRVHTDDGDVTLTSLS